MFGDRDSGAYLIKFSWTKIVRHAMVRGAASPDDPALAGYWADRRRKQPPPPIERHRSDTSTDQSQEGPMSPVLRRSATSRRSNTRKPRTQWEQWVRVPPWFAISQTAHHLPRHGEVDGIKPRLIHSFCRRPGPPPAPDPRPATAPA